MGIGQQVRIRDIETGHLVLNGTIEHASIENGCMSPIMVSIDSNQGFYKGNLYYSPDFEQLTLDSTAQEKFGVKGITNTRISSL